MSSAPTQTVPPRPKPVEGPFHGNISFNAQHAPMGAFFSFTCGHVGTRGGFGLQLGKPGNQDLYIGVKDGDRFSDAPLKVLPFYEGATDNEAARYDVERAAGPAEQNVKPRVLPYAAGQISRHYGWATDRWATDDFEFTIYTPFGAIRDPQVAGADVRSDLLPAIVATLTIDNRDGRTTKTGCFAIQFPDRGARILDAGLHAAFALRSELGVAGTMADDGDDPAFTFMRWSPSDGLRSNTPVHHLGTCPGIGFEVPPGEKRTLRLALGCYLGGVVTTRLEGRYLYTRYYSDLLDVLNAALTSFGGGVEAHDLDAKLLASGLSPDQQFLIAHATRSYYGSTQLLDVGGQPFWVVNEGEYCMMNTLDLAVDQAFWELDHNPWVVRNLLDNFVRYYAYADDVKEPKTGKRRAGGISFCHDQGAHNQFAPLGHSSYELPELTRCFSYMTAEQLCNWTLTAACYAAKARDEEWVRRNLHTIDACLTSLINRGGEPGFCQYDSARCGEKGAEITTYDSLDHSLAQTRANVYMATKTWATYLGLARLLEADLPDRAGLARRQAERVEEHVLARVGPDGVLPAVFERDNPGHGSRILPAAEGLLYPLVWGDEAATRGRLAQALRRHTLALLRDPQRRNLFPDGGIKLSSTSNNSWMSKIALFQHVAREVFQFDGDPDVAEMFAAADAAHVCWQTEGPSAYWACSDQFVSGVAKGSRYYPRIITAALWLSEARASQARLPEGKRLRAVNTAGAR